MRSPVRHIAVGSLNVVLARRSVPDSMRNQKDLASAFALLRYQPSFGQRSCVPTPQALRKRHQSCTPTSRISSNAAKTKS